MKFVELLFERYIKQVYEGPISEVQRKELKNCFYAAYWSAIHEISSVSSALPEDVACQMLDKLSQECQDHAKEVLEKMYRSN